MDQWLKDNQHWLVGLLVVGVMALSYKAFVLDAGKSFSLFSGFKSGANLALDPRLGAVRDDPGFDHGGATQSLPSESMTPNEPPVFWNAGSFEVINKHQQSSKNDEPDSSAEGMRNRVDVPLSYEGFDAQSLIPY